MLTEAARAIVTIITIAFVFETRLNASVHCILLVLPRKPVLFQNITAAAVISYIFGITMGGLRGRYSVCETNVAFLKGSLNVSLLEPFFSVHNAFKIHEHTILSLSPLDPSLLK